MKNDGSDDLRDPDLDREAAKRYFAERKEARRLERERNGGVLPQDELSRARRRQAGECPTHGIALLWDQQGRPDDPVYERGQCMHTQGCSYEVFKNHAGDIVREIEPVRGVKDAWSMLDSGRSPRWARQLIRDYVAKLEEQIAKLKTKMKAKMGETDSQ